ncbi:MULTISPECIES: CpaF family protein [unclassified Nocardioides]|uniref:CpaF family protein n=1 Tax=unclassified Nocardioides TaxID=2615069 RepID=UPI0009F140A3|nr:MULTISPECIES: CpaF/VirB11 family protein [unclassified Nocardioides]GAW49707.1 type II secretion system protein E [Nocardioides sp. PD653-B2]GAW56553.1 type II secretion system protein E [Nocardioides sp. PD653]
MSTDGHHPETNGRDPLRADEWLEARHAANREKTSPFARGRSTNGTPPPPPAPVVEDHDPTSLPIFAGAWTSEGEDRLQGRARSEFSLPPLVAPAPEEHHHILGADGGVELDWELIAQYRAEISSRLTARLDKEGGRVTEEDREQMGLDVIEELIKSEAETLVSTGRPPWTKDHEKALKCALHAALFGLGRLQPLVEREDVENIIVIARGPLCSVWLELVDGTLVEAAPIADSEDELREFLSDLGARQNRPFTEARPHLDLRLPGGARLAAGSWVMAYTSVVIRRHGMREVSMDEMVYDRKACSPVLADFVAACVRAGKSIVVSGVQGSGKTTWVRALCSCIPPWEMIGTFETEFELHLHELVDRHKIVHAWEHRPGSGEVGIDGRQAGEFSLEEAIHHSFRFNLARQIVGEVRGPEVWNMLKAMESGPGSISTTHARSAEHTIEKLVSCAMEKGPQVTRELAISKLAAAIDIVMYLRSEVVANPDGTFRKHRWVEEVLVVQPSIDAARGYATTPIFAPNQLGQAVTTGKLDNFLAQELARHGFDLEAYKAESQANPGVATS